MNKHIIKLEIIILYLLLYYYYIMKFILLYYYYIIIIVIIIIIIIIIIILLVYHEIIILYNHLLYFFINCISTRSAPQMLSLKDEYNLRCSNFLIIIRVILLLIVRLTKYHHQKSFYQKICKILKQFHVDIHHILGF